MFISNSHPVLTFSLFFLISRICIALLPTSVPSSRIIPRYCLAEILWKILSPPHLRHVLPTSCVILTRVRLCSLFRDFASQSKFILSIAVCNNCVIIRRMRKCLSLCLEGRQKAHQIYSKTCSRRKLAQNEQILHSPGQKNRRNVLLILYNAESAQGNGKQYCTRLAQFPWYHDQGKFSRPPLWSSRQRSWL
jgi:hypothetical protein